MAGPSLNVPTDLVAPASPLPTRAVRQRWDDVFLGGLGVRVPDVTLSTAELEDRIRPLYRKLGFKPGWVEAVTGIAERRVWGPGGDAVSGAVQAAHAALAEAGLPAASVQVVVSCSVYKPRLEPSMACEIQGALGVGPHCLNFDISNACLGFVTGLSVVANMIAMGQVDTALVVSGEDATPVLDATIARLTDPSADIHTFKDNLATLTLGSAAAAAVVTSPRAARSQHRLLGMTTVSAAEHHGLCTGDTHGMVTDSARLLREGVALAGRTWAEFTDLLGWSIDDVTTAAMHQVGKAHHDTVARHLGVPADRAPSVYPWLGNIGSCGVPVTATLARDQGHFRSGDKVALMGIGSGLNCAMAGVAW
ncbi:MAG: 3-oxoacyl-ACP synthase III [Alphaproteobacteria bacterium]|nr:3-oxoacyl-ACP synthase III [Alphaproteobacteria bacterium]